VVLVIAFLLDSPTLVAALAVVLIAAVLGGPGYNLLAYLYRALPIPRGEPEAAAPPRFAQMIGAVFLTISSVFLYSAAPETSLWWTLGWGPALAVAVLAALAASTAF
jgi:hypothetical protein